MIRSNDGDPLPESAMGGASDAGAHGKHPSSATKLEGSPLPDAPCSLVAGEPFRSAIPLERNDLEPGNLRSGLSHPRCS